jgi:hypothetical protein
MNCVSKINVSFEKAVKMATKGAIILRDEWQNQFVYYVPEKKIKAKNWTGFHHNWIQDDLVIIKGHFDMRLPTAEIRVGWIPTAEDILANDWAYSFAEG